MALDDRLASVLDRLAAATSVGRTRADDVARAARHGRVRDGQLEALVLGLEDSADRIWRTLDGVPAKMRRAA